MSQPSFKVFAFDGLRGDPAASGSTLTGTLTGGSVIRIMPGPRARIIWTPPAQAPVVLVVNRSILARLVVTTDVYGPGIPPGSSHASVQVSTDTTIALREPVRLERDPAVSESEGIYENLGTEVQVVLPALSRLTVLEPAAGSASWLEPVDPGPPGPPPPPPGVSKPFPWLPVVGGVVLLGVCGWLLFGKSKKSLEEGR